MKSSAIQGWTVAAALLLLLVGSRSSADQIDFNSHIRPILAENCYRCHGPDAAQRKGGTDGMRLDVAEGALADLGGYAAIVPGKPDESEMIRRVTSDDEDEAMPPAEVGRRLTPGQVDLLRQWIKQGADYAAHWSYVPPLRPDLPAVEDTKWIKNDIDRFILARLQREGLAPSPEAQPAALARRVSLDVTGLPPTVDQVDRFLADKTDGAYERFVDRLLGKEAYGEHWARMWLDLARYADSAGYADDPGRTIWAYRDYVIRSLNANKRFDQFTIEQIAGDLLPSATDEQRIATAFHRNTQTNSEGGTDDEEYRNVAIVDRVNTTMAVWMGTTIHCCQCHSHKYDPITQEEFFRLFAIFNNTQDADRRDEKPLIDLWTDEQRRQKAEWQSQIDQLEKKLATAAPDQEKADRDRLANLKKQLAEIKPATTVPVMREIDGERRETHIQYRGNFLDKGPAVTEGVPAVFHALTTDQPVDRLALARWLIDDDNPLTARVIANRYWENIFGIGIVRTSEEFGTQGELPTHPELLDYLATDLVASGWDLKYLVRLLVTSAAYRQTSRVTGELLERDPDNRLLARGPRFRLSAEMIRDQALFVSGFLSSKMYGPQVRPYQPAFGVSAAFGITMDWPISKGEDKYRRGLYTTWKRSNPYPSMVTFDAPSREVCTVRRDRTNSPLQALVTLNDPVYVEAAQALARRIAAGGATTADRARYGFRLCLARRPRQAELDQLTALYDKAYARYSKDAESAKLMATDPLKTGITVHERAAIAESAKHMATDPLGPVPEGMEIAELAAWTVVGNVLLNLDEMLMKR